MRTAKLFGLAILASAVAMGASMGCSSSDDEAPPETPGLEDSGAGEGDGDTPEGDAGDGDSGADGGSDGSSDGGDEDGGDDASTPGHSKEQVVGSAGGTVEAPSGVSIEIPAGALPSDVTITIDEAIFPPSPEGAIPLGKTFQLGPEGQTFAKPVKVKLPWSGPDNVPVEIAHAPKGGGTWTRLTENAGFDETHVWAETSSFSWFQPVVYQGAPDTPIILDNANPTGWRKLVARGSTPTLSLQGTGFRGDTIVKLFKDGVTTTAVAKVTLTKWGLEFQIPAEFTATLGLITIEAKNPAATVGDAAAVHVIETPVLQSLSPSTVDIAERDDNDYRNVNISISVTATDLPDDLSLCRVDISQSWGDVAARVAEMTAPSKTASGFEVVATDWDDITGQSDLRLFCSGVSSNELPITFNKIPKP